MAIFHGFGKGSRFPAGLALMVDACQNSRNFLQFLRIGIARLANQPRFFLKKMHFLLCISPFGCLIGYRQAHDPHRHSSCFSKTHLPVRHAGTSDFPHARAAGCHPQRCVHLQRQERKPPKACRGIGQDRRRCKAG